MNLVGELIQDFGGLGLCGGYDVAVNVAGGGGLSVAQVAGYDYQRGLVGNQQVAS